MMTVSAINVVAIVQARRGSTRLPNKVLLDVAGRPMLAQQIRRLKRCRSLSGILVATTTHEADGDLVELARREGVAFFRGSESDVLARFVGAAREAKADVIVRVTGDCPLIDAAIIDRVVEELTSHAHECDYASNVGLVSQPAASPDAVTIPLERSFPRGLDAEAFFSDTLWRMDRLGTSPAAREHVTYVARSERPDAFLMRTVRDVADNSDLRWTVDTEDDLRLIRTLYEELDLSKSAVPYAQILAYVRSNPHLTQMNAHVQTLNG
jgi:spore coat polysaccharide biosynthesis protein SpsF